jgi:hypothetical protein
MTKERIHKRRKERMERIEIGATQKGVLALLSDLEWWTTRKAVECLENSGADQALRRLASRGLLDVRTGRGVPHHEYRLSSAGLDVVLSLDHDIVMTNHDGVMTDHDNVMRGSSSAKSGEAA